MKLTCFTKITVRGAAAGLMLLAVSLIMARRRSPASAQNGRSGRLHIVKDCDTDSGIPGSELFAIS